MPHRLFINQKDAAQEWGLSLSEGALSALIAPPPLKELATQHSRLEHGTRTLTALPPTATQQAPSSLLRWDERTLSLPVHFVASSLEQLVERQQAFFAEMQKGIFTLRHEALPSLTFRLLYVACTEYSQAQGRLSKCILRLTEPNPTLR